MIDKRFNDEPATFFQSQAAFHSCLYIYRIKTMNDKVDHIVEVNTSGRQDRVVIEDYRGPASVLPPPASSDAQITALPETKQKPETSSQTADAKSWPLTLSVLGFACGSGAVGGLLPAFIATINRPLSSSTSPSSLHYVLFSLLGVLIICLAIIGFILSTIALFRYRSARSQDHVLGRSLIGLVLNGLALLVILLGYIFGW
jgi:hypothetical protein